jgi:hypothetical protein
MRFSDLEFYPRNGGIQSIVEFGNYELSIIQTEFSYGGTEGLYEIGVFKNGCLTEVEGVTDPDDSVKGFLTEDEVTGILLKMHSITGCEGAQI